jgi:hypothetical protein
MEANDARKAANKAMGIGMEIKGHNWNAVEHCEEAESLERMKHDVVEVAISSWDSFSLC